VPLEFHPENELEQVILDAKGGSLDVPEFMSVALRSTLYILIRSEVQVEQKYNELAPLLVGQGDHRLVAVFSSPSRASFHGQVATFVLEIDGSDFFQRLPPTYGVSLNPGYSAELSVSSKAISDFCRATEHARQPQDWWRIIVDPTSDSETLCRKICYAVMERRHHDLEPLMQSVFLKENKLVLLAELAYRLPGSSLDNLFLCGLSHLLGLGEDDYRELFALSSGRAIAIYNLTSFLMSHGRTNKRVLQRLCENFSEIERVDQFRVAFDDSPSSDTQISNGERFRQRIYNWLEIPIESVVAFRGKFAAMK
jgi:hypothetical protein